MLEITLRKSNLFDENFVNELTYTLMHDYVKKTWSDKSDQEKYFYTNKFNPQNTYIIQHEGKDVGRITLIKYSDHIYVDNIHLIPECQSKGIGFQILNEKLNDAKKENLYLKLQVLRVNPAKLLYERLGFYVYEENSTHFFMRTN